ncbi:3-hydroxyacyl-CoA dehydrogenase NAD-binding domain-containing protein [Faecalibaculum rodentium]|jgi:3-hydroxybutyryl-CoA dehydrogenase|uniref:Putative 3-hydroxybutyryl-CoA dehydrogenase n=4 Tax=Faecalibaculum rodentium TaxID=1702221 RepID=A0A140DS69_9FIRM|nr:3-hydroxyacyl-CoA dehydrogenase NAD-binding domain-containing protein [Faecalibaculum rodentium]AMK53496.1 putative 3-hydroxybutyryl-CoA dehydrogenase [Faecalibaculum rodentium]OLU44200.1 hypothetical protein BO223_09200 [Faecalibaculum rodentium]
MNKVTVIGGGVLGSQIALVCAYHGLDTWIWLRSPASIDRAKPKLKKAFEEIMADIERADGDPARLPAGLQEPDITTKKAKEKARRALESVHLELNLEKALAGADIVIESMSEDPKAKAEMYAAMAPLLTKDQILVTNSSTLLPSMFADMTGCPERYLALHFANHIWRNNLTEVMAQPKTDPEVFDEVMTFARSISMDPVAVRKERSGYLLNSMLVPFLFSAMDLLVTGTGDVKDIDKAWVKGAGAPYGPFRMLDTIGLETARNIAHNFAAIPEEMAPFHYRDIERMLTEKIDRKEKFCD